jgi:bifunctional DNA-binding transcriptional regulator/antitoxin component of YhaV-PrlF toxin-antitoxin module
MAAVARVTTKGQTTIPREIRAAMRVSPGDLIAWEPRDDGSATVRRVQPLDLDYLRALDATLSEWASDADEEAYRDL